MPVYPWSSLGSEIEVIEMQNFNLRSLLVVEIDSSFPIFGEKRIFSIREAKDAVYMECSTNRHEYKNVWRKRIDVGCQVRAKLKNAFVQTRTSTSLNNYTEYQQQVSVKTPNKNIDNKIAVFFDTCIDNVMDYLQLNYHIHLHTNDYKDFINPYIPQKYTDFKESVACQDIRYCHGKQVSCVSWNPFISGIFAASYMRTNFYHVYSSQPYLKGAEIFDLNVALVWSFSDMQKPKLYLHSIRELTYISFCPYNGNIVVGGCSNGQIVIWDIRGQLSKVENKEKTSQKQIDNQMAIHKLVLWIKKLPSVGHVNPSVVSNLKYSHKTAITNISWIPPEHYISTTGQYRNSEKNNPHMQFVTSSLEDKSVLVWDVKHNRYPEGQMQKKPIRSRLSKLPSALHKDDSSLKRNLTNFIPTFMLIVKDTVSQTPIHITSVQLNNHKYIYEEEEEILVENHFKRIHFSLSTKNVVYDCTQFLTVNTMSGSRYDCTWEGFTYDHGNKVNFDSCLLSVYAAVHDAPVKMCVVNSNEPDVLLSVGGKVFSVWYKKERTPILWRKCTSNYIFGKWSHAQPFEILLFTYDGFIQLWNFFVNSKAPTFVMRLHGLPPTEIYSNVGVEHYIQNAILLSDELGAIRVQTAGGRLVDMSVQSFDQQESISKFIETKQQVRKCVAFWNEYSKRKQCVVEPEEIKTETVHVPAVEETKKKEAKNIISKIKEKFEKKQHKFMYERLTEFKGIEWKQLDKDKIVLNKILAQSNELSRKYAKALGNKKEIRLISWDAAKLDRKIYKISLSKDTANNLKRQYFENYLLLEEQFANNLKEYKFVFNLKRFKQCKVK